MGLRIVDLTPGEPAPQRISLCMIVRDEEEHLARCLRSVEGVVDEIVVVDTGSADRTVEIAESFGARVLREEWRGDFAAPRNTAIDAATGDWILVLDADEELVDGHALRDLVRQEGIEGYSFREVNFIGEERGIECVVNSAFRLFRNRPEYRYEGALHEQIMGKVDPEGGARTRFVGVEIHHYGYLEPTSRAKEKTDRNMAIVMEEVARKPEDSFTLFNAGVEFQRIGEHETALDYFRRAFRHLPSLRAYFASLLVRNIVASLNALERYDEALEVLADALEAYPDFTDMHYLRGQVHANRREYRAAVRSFRTAIELGDHGGDLYLAQAGMGSFYSWHALGALHELMGDAHEAARCYRSAVRAADGYFPAPLVRLARLLLESDPPEEVRAFLTGIISDRRRADSLRAIGAVFVAMDHPREALDILAEARRLAPEDHATSLALADALLRAGDPAGARIEAESVPATSASHHLALGKRVLIALAEGDEAAARAAIAELAPVADGLYARTYAAALEAVTAGASAAPAGVERGAALEVLLELTAALLELGRLEAFNALVPLLYATAGRREELDERLGHLLAANDFPDPAADRLMAAVRADAASPDAYAALGRICGSKGMVEEAEAFLRAALERDAQNTSRHLDLAGLLAGAGRYADADDVLREGLLVHPHSTVLRELRESMTLLAGA